jgi:hypothetical protein
MRRVGCSIFGKNRLDDALTKELIESGIEVVEVAMGSRCRF